MYSFGHKREIATLEETDEYLELSIELDKGFDSLKYLQKYKDSISLAGIKNDRAILRIHNLGYKENLTEDLIDLTKIKCEIDIQKFGNIVSIHVWFSETPYKKCIKMLTSCNLSFNRRKTKWWGDTDIETADKIISELSKFKYLSICNE